MPKFQIGDTVRVSQDHSAKEWRGLIGTVTGYPKILGEDWVNIKTEEKGEGGFLGQYLERVVSEGSMISPDSVTVGMEIEVTKVSGDLTLTNRGVVDKIITESGSVKFLTKSGRNIHLNVTPETITLIKNAPADPLIAELAALKGGSVVQREDTAGSSTVTFSYVKRNPTPSNKGIWHFFNPSSSSSSIEVSEEHVLTVIKTKGAEIVIRK